MDQEEKALTVEKLQSYIEQHLKEPITLKNLSASVGYSPYYVDRFFLEIVGISPFEYIRRRRLTDAALYMRDKKVKVIDVALDFIFNSQEGFTRAFTKEFGISPYRYHKNTPAIPLFLPQNAYESYLSMTNHSQTTNGGKKMRTVFAQVIEKPERKCIIKRGQTATEYFEYCNEVGCEVWGVLTSIKEAIYEPMGMWLPEAMRDGKSEYVQGVEVPLAYDKPIPEGFELITLPAYQVMVFQGEPYENDEDYEEAVGEIWGHIKDYKPELYGYQWDPASGPRFQLAPMAYRGYIEGRPVKKIS